jgi:transcriptional regulator with XRE-family HTH domain
MVELLDGIGHNIRQLREEKGWNQTELGFHADASPSIISLIENGKRNPSTATLAKIAGALGVEVVDLFPKASGRSPYEPTFNDVLAEERRADGKGPDESMWGAPQNRPGPEERMPESAGHHIDVEIRDDLSTKPTRVTITRTAFLDMLRRHGLAEPAAKEVIDELHRTSAA